MGKQLIIVVCFLTIMATLSGCGAPLFRSDNELFAPAPGVIEKLQPYLASWATKPPEQTLKQRKEIDEQVDEVLFIDTIGPRTAQDGSTFYIIDIELEVWADWARGYFYVHDGSSLTERPGLSLRRVDEHFYMYSWTDKN